MAALSELVLASSTITHSNIVNRMIKNKENLVRADSASTGAEIELAVERLSPNWIRAVPRQRTGGASHILQNLARGHAHAVVLEIKRSPRRLDGLPLPNADCRYQR
jgi:hypothetical protein